MFIVFFTTFAVGKRIGRDSAEAERFEEKLKELHEKRKEHLEDMLLDLKVKRSILEFMKNKEEAEAEKEPVPEEANK